MKRANMMSDGGSPCKRKRVETVFSTTELIEIAKFCFPEQQFILQQLGDPFPEAFWEEIFLKLHDYRPNLSFFTRIVGSQYQWIQCRCNQARFGIYTDLELAKADMSKIYETVWNAECGDWQSAEVFAIGREAYRSEAQISEFFMSFTFTGHMEHLNRIGIMTLEHEKLPPDQSLNSCDLTKDWQCGIDVEDDIQKWLPGSSGLKAYTHDNRSFQEKVSNPRWYALYHIRHYRDCFFCLDGTVSEDAEKITSYFKPEFKELSMSRGVDEKEPTMKLFNQLREQVSELEEERIGFSASTPEEVMYENAEACRICYSKIARMKYRYAKLCNSLCVCTHGDDEFQIGKIIRFNSPHLHAGMSLSERLTQALPHGQSYRFDPLNPEHPGLAAAMHLRK